MEYLPRMLYSDGISKYQTVKFGGYDHNISAGDGTIWDMMNMNGDDYPIIGTRKKRLTVYSLSNANGMFSHDDLFYVDGTKLYKNGAEIAGLTLGNSRKTFASLGPYVIILPDKVYYNTYDSSFGNIEKSTGAIPVKIQDGTYAGESAKANTILYKGSDTSFEWSTYFKVGDAVTIDGCTVHTENNKTPIIREIDGKYLRFYENVFTISSGGDSESSVTLSTTMPDLDFICENENRLWGCKGDTIYASKLGDIFDWNVFDGLSTDSYSVDVGSAGDFTACVSYLGYPIFFKEEKIYKVYGSKPSNYQVMSSASLGVEAGSDRSLAVAGEILFYLSRAGIVAYSGGTPQSISSAFGDVRYKNAVGGSDGINYFVSMQRTDGEYDLFVYNTRNGQWYREDCTQALSFAWRGDLYMLTSDGKVVISEDSRTIPARAVSEGRLTSFIEFGDFVESSPNRKGTSKLQLRLDLALGSKVTVYIKFDSGDTWTRVREIISPEKKSYYLPIIPRRSDHYRIRIEGEGEWQLYSLIRENYIGSEL